MSQKLKISALNEKKMLTGPNEKIENYLPKQQTQLQPFCTNVSAIIG